MSTFKFTDILNPTEQDTLLDRIDRITIEQLVENENNNYSLVDIEELANSIEELGLLQPLLVKEIENNKYEIIAGHRRYNAIKYLIEQGRLNSNYYVLVKKSLNDESELITRLKLHETNLQTRSLLKMSEEDKLAVVEDYMDILQQAREQGLEINGKPVKGKTRDLIAERFNISDKTARKIIREIKEGGKVPTPPKKEVTLDDKTKKIIKQIEEQYNFIADNINDLDIDTRQELKSKLKKFLDLNSTEGNSNYLVDSIEDEEVIDNSDTTTMRAYTHREVAFITELTYLEDQRILVSISDKHTKEVKLGNYVNPGDKEYAYFYSQLNKPKEWKMKG